MSREVHVRFCEGLGLKCPGLLTPTSGPTKVGSILPRFSTCIRVASLDGRRARTTTAPSHLTLLLPDVNYKSLSH